MGEEGSAFADYLVHAGSEGVWAAVLLATQAAPELGAQAFLSDDAHVEPRLRRVARNLASERVAGGVEPSGLCLGIDGSIGSGLRRCGHFRSEEGDTRFGEQ